MSVGRALAQVPVRLRLTLAFAVVMAALLSATGLFLYLRLGSALDRTIDQSLRSRADDVAALIGQDDAGLWEEGGNRLADQRERFAQVLESSGTVVDATPELGDRPLLTGEQLARASRTTTWVERATIRGRTTRSDCSPRLSKSGERPTSSSSVPRSRGERTPSRACSLNCSSAAPSP